MHHSKDSRSTEAGSPHQRSTYFHAINLTCCKFRHAPPKFGCTKPSYATEWYRESCQLASYTLESPLSRLNAPHCGLRTENIAKSNRHSIALSVGTSLCSYEFAYRWVIHLRRIREIPVYSAAWMIEKKKVRGVPGPKLTPPAKLTLPLLTLIACGDREVTCVIRICSWVWSLCHQPSGLDQIDGFRFPISWLAEATSPLPAEKCHTSQAWFGPILRAGAVDSVRASRVDVLSHQDLHLGLWLGASCRVWGVACSVWVVGCRV